MITYVKHEYLRSRASKCLSLSSSSSSLYLSVKSLIFLHILTSIEILVLISWIPASENFYLSETLKCCLFVLIPGRQLFDPPSNKGSRNLKNTFSAMRIQLFFSFIFHMEHLVLFKLCCYFPLK